MLVNLKNQILTKMNSNYFIKEFEIFKYQFLTSRANLQLTSNQKSLKIFFTTKIFEYFLKINFLYIDEKVFQESSKNIVFQESSKNIV